MISAEEKVVGTAGSDSSGEKECEKKKPQGSFHASHLQPLEFMLEALGILHHYTSPVSLSTNLDEFIMFELVHCFEV